MTLTQGCKAEASRPFLYLIAYDKENTMFQQSSFLVIEEQANGNPLS